jgi:tRNA1Val (adenine37-N6)-methyltransferase
LKYDLIICNPPFYENDLLPEDDGRNISKHSTALNLEELLFVSKNLLNDNGVLAVLLPCSRAKSFETKALKLSLFVKEKMQVKQTLSHKYFRAMLILQKQKTTTLENILTIRNNENEYSDEFKDLLKDYYLYL